MEFTLSRGSWDTAVATLSTGLAVSGATGLLCYLMYTLWLLAQLRTLALRHTLSLEGVCGIQ